MAEDDPELWIAIHRLTSVLEGLDQDELHVDGILDTIKQKGVDLWNKLKGRPPFKEQPPADNFASTKSEPYKNIQHLKTFYGTDVKNAIDKQIKAVQGSPKQVERWKKALVDVDDLTKELRIQEDALNKLSYNQQLCDYHAEDVKVLRSLLTGYLEELKLKENLPLQSTTN